MSLRDELNSATAHGNETASTPAVASVLAGLLTRDQLAKQFGLSERTVIRWEHAGLPVIKLGMTRLYDPAKARDWLMSHERRRGVPRGVGRPAHKIAI
jgi:hypothetical protein